MSSTARPWGLLLTPPARIYPAATCWLGASSKNGVRHMSTLSYPAGGVSLPTLGRILRMWALFLGIADLAILARVGAWLDYDDIGTLGACYTAALVLGVALAPRLQ